jgi:hypothetical protein
MLEECRSYVVWIEAEAEITRISWSCVSVAWPALRVEG